MKFGGLKLTTSSIMSQFDNANFTCVIPENTDPEELKIVKTICPAIQGGASISSMINAGMKKTKRPWNMIVVSGHNIRYSPVLKYTRFTKSTKDVLYPVMDKSYWKWCDSSIHGILVHKEAFTEVGDFPDNEENLPMCRLIWSINAVEKGYVFKGLIGAKLF
jgi:hypothetical protein